MDFYLKVAIPNIRGAPSVAGLRCAATGSKHSGWSVHGIEVAVTGYGLCVSVMSESSEAKRFEFTLLTDTI